MNDNDDNEAAIAEAFGALIEPLVELVCWLGVALPSVVFWPLVFVLASLGLSFCAGWLP
jgi:hypothetical protein